jgi:hypothetical protein
MGLFNDAKAPSIGEEAATAFAAGRFVFVAVLDARLKRDTQISREIDLWSDEIMSIERAGWGLTQMSTVEADHSVVRMYCVFNRL